MYHPLLDQGIDPNDHDDYPSCPICGSGNVEWEDCYTCFGAGGFDGDDLMDEDPLWYGPDDYEICDTCRGAGGWWHCYDSDKHPKTETETLAQ